MAIDLNSTNNIHRFDFPSHRFSISSECGNQKGNEDDRAQLQDTVPLDSPTEESEFCNINLDTELQCDSDRGGGGEKTTEPPCEYEEEIVLDSEDEEINGSRVVAVTKSLPDNEAEKKSEQRCAGSEVLLTSFGNEKDLPEQPACEGELVRLNNKSTQKLEEWSQADALGFVDHFVLINKFGMSPGTETDYRKTCREKSPAVPSAEGPRNLARRISQQAHIEEKWKLEFMVNDPYEGLDSFRKKRSFRRKRIDILDDEGRDRKGISDLGKETKDLSDLDKGFAGHSSKVETNTEVNSSKELELTGKKLDFSEMGSDTLDICDIGFNTQIAAEAIEALAYGYPFGHGSANAFQDMENNADGSLRGVGENNAKLKLPSIQKSACYDTGDILGSVKRKKRSDRKFGRGISSLSRKQPGIKECNPELTKLGLVKRKKLLAESGLCGNNSANSNESSGRSPPNPVMQREKGVLENNSNMISATPVQNIPQVNEQSEGQGVKVTPFSCRTRQHDLGVNPGEKVKDTVEQGILAYIRKRRCLNANPLKVLNVRGKSLKLRSSSKGARQITWHTFSKSDMWNCPKGKRTSRQVGKHSTRIIDLNVPFNPHNHDRMIGKANMKEEAESKSSSRNDFPRSLSGKSFAEPDLAVSISERETAVMRIVSTDSECIASVAIGAEKDHTIVASSNKTLEHSGSECTTFSSKTGKNAVPSNNTYSHYDKRPCQKNVPRRSLLKELIKLGVPEQIPEFAWKELRRRRDMAHVRILFSQHLDADIVKQQKKVAARLGTSIASCSMDATHFVADTFARTKNMLEAIALGKPVVTHLWLESCGEENCFIDERNYILRDAKKEKEFGFCMPVSLARANQHPLLKGQRVFVTPNIKPEKEVIINLVKAVHGQPVEKLQISALKDENIPEGLLILSCKEDHSICLPFLKKGSSVYSSELLLNGIVTQRLDYKRHQLFDVKRNCF